MPAHGETLEELSGPMIGPYEFPPKLVWTNGALSSLKVSVLTGIGPEIALPWAPDMEFVTIAESCPKPRSPFGMSAARSVINYGKSVTMSVVGGAFRLQMPTLILSE